MLAMLADPDAEGIVLLLDIYKAYDTLNRDFLWDTLRAFGFSANFVGMTQRLYHGTSARFEVDGQLSQPVPVVAGIRQGCPLAPLLFLLAIEILGEAIRRHPDLDGVHLRSGDVHRFSGFVDDSAICVRDGAMLPTVLGVLDKFAALSGLAIQPAKCVAIPLGDTQVPAATDLPVLAPEARTRYLGIQIGRGELGPANWERRLHAIQVRLNIANRVSNSVPSRVAIVNVVAHAAFLFTARFFTPTMREILRYEEIIRCYINGGAADGGVRVQVVGTVGLEPPPRAFLSAHPSVCPTPAFDTDDGIPGRQRWQDTVQFVRYIGPRQQPRIVERLRRQLLRNPVVAPSLQRCTWPALWWSDGWLGPHHTFFWYRLAGGHLRLRHGASGAANTCTHRYCDKPDSIDHTFWDCPVARSVWQGLAALWGHTALQVQHVFSRQAPAPHPSLRERYEIW
ncbi:hypothetical protein ATCC90586_002558 [Pythium insidiosum]|nr:hypothetical protein ATCC90586_002558 [Pythium insidiosum]